MANKMLIDAAHPEETRVVVLRGNRVEEFDFESASKKQLRGNIYLAKVTRVEPSLQAAFVDYGGNRHGFLAFAEIHPDYYQIPVSDRQALLEAEAHEEHEEEEERRSRRRRRRGNDRHAAASTPRDESVSETAEHAGEHAETGNAEAAHAAPEAASAEDAGEAPAPISEATAAETTAAPEQLPVTVDAQEREKEPALPEPSPEGDPLPLTGETADAPHAAGSDEHQAPSESHDAQGHEEAHEERHGHAHDDDHVEAHGEEHSRGHGAKRAAESDSDEDEDEEDEEEHVEQLGGDALEEVPHRAFRPRRQYKIQEVIKRRQVLLVQVVKEERGNKGAALTTYLSLAGRYSVLMPNTARGGGISRKITDATDRQRLKSIAQELDVPEGMGVILRTAGASRTKPEVKRDFEYLMRAWETVRETTLKSQAPTLVYEEGSLIKRAIRDLYNKDIDEVIVSGEGGYREAKDFMRLLMPSHSRNVQPWRDPQPIFTKFGAEAQLDAMFSNHVTLKSGGYIVINQTEALVAIDVNSGRSTREHNIEDTALRTNLEAADEVARQLRLRDLAGLIVVDFIDMEESRNNRAVERRMKEALKNDRARIQIGRISHFGLLEMSRQRIRTGVLEGSTVVCEHCAGSGMVRSTASIALYVLRTLEDSLIADASHNLIVKTRVPVALYILNQKRGHLTDLEQRFGVAIAFEHDHALTGTTYCAIEKGEPATGVAQPVRQLPVYAPEPEEPVLAEEEADLSDEDGGADDGQGDVQGRREDGNGEGRRRRRRRRGRDRGHSEIAPDAPQPPDDALAFAANATDAAFGTGAEEEGEDDGEAEGEDNAGANGEARGRRRRSRRGGRRAREARERREGAPGSEPGSDEQIADAESTGDETVVAEAHEVGSAAEPATAEPLAVEAPQGETPKVETPKAETPKLEAAPAQTAEGEVPAAAAPASTAASMEPVEPAAAEAPPAPAASPRPEPVSSELDPSRPKRSGWWQRAKATLSGH